MSYQPDPVFNDTLEPEPRATPRQIGGLVLFATVSLASCAAVMLYLVARRLYGLPERTYQIAKRRLA